MLFWGKLRANVWINWRNAKKFLAIRIAMRDACNRSGSWFPGRRNPEITPSHVSVKFDNFLKVVKFSVHRAFSMAGSWKINIATSCFFSGWETGFRGGVIRRLHRAVYSINDDGGCKHPPIWFGIINRTAVKWGLKSRTAVQQLKR